jgi:hypothetical protein
MSTNIGVANRIFRLGLIPLGSALTGFCPVRAALGRGRP